MSAASERFKEFAAKRPPFWRFSLWLILIAGSAALFPVTVRTEHFSTCLLCRAHRHVSTFLDWKREQVRENAFTAWYLQNRPAHEHQWEATGPMHKLNLFGIATAHSCGIYHPLARLPPDRELEFVRTAKPEEVEAFFSALVVTHTNRLERFAAARVVIEPLQERHQPRRN